MTKSGKMLLALCLSLLCAQAAMSATFTVSKIADTSDGACDADCSLREAIAAAGSSADNDVIVFDDVLFASRQTITLSGSEIVIVGNGALTINGPGADKLTISGNNASRILTNSVAAVTSISGITFTGGNGVGAANTGRAGAIYNNGGNLTMVGLIITGNSAGNGGGTNHAGNATTSYVNCIISNNSATGAGGGMQNFSGSILVMTNSTVTGNTSNSTLTGGGGIQANGTLTFTNTTFSRNTAAGGDGGALVYNGQGLTMNNVTIANNAATGTGGAGGLHKSTSLLNANVRNTVMAGNTGQSADAAGVFNSQGDNVIANPGTSSGWVKSDILNTDAMLAPLGFYGGFGMTHALLNGSPALDNGNNCVLDLSCGTANPPIPVVMDQRGAARPANTTVDVGAFERSAAYVAVLPAYTPNEAYSFTIVPVAAGMTFTVSSGSLPPGITVTSDGSTVTIGGTTAVGGTFDFVLTNGTGTLSVNYRLASGTTAVNASVSGKVMMSPGNGLGRAIVTITNGSGFTLSTRTNNFGNYSFSGVPTGATYTVSVFAKELSFAPQMVEVNDNVSGVDFLPTAPAVLERK